MTPHSDQLDLTFENPVENSRAVHAEPEVAEWGWPAFYEEDEQTSSEHAGMAENLEEEMPPQEPQHVTISKSVAIVSSDHVAFVEMPEQSEPLGDIRSPSDVTPIPSVANSESSLEVCSP